MRTRSLLLLAACAFGLAACGSSTQSADKTSGTTAATTKHLSCPKAVDALSVQVGQITETLDIGGTVALQSLKACDGPATWKLYAGVDQLGARFLALHGASTTDDSSSATALDLVCSRFDDKNATATCSGR